METKNGMLTIEYIGDERLFIISQDPTEEEFDESTQIIFLDTAEVRSLINVLESILEENQ